MPSVVFQRLFIFTRKWLNRNHKTININLYQLERCRNTADAQNASTVFVVSVSVLLGWWNESNQTILNQAIEVYMGVSLNGGTPKTPQNDHF